MPAVPLRIDPTVRLDAEFDAIRRELGIDGGFPAAAEAEAAGAAARGPSVPAEVDLRDVPFLTVDPPGSMDLDQALHLAVGPGGGYLFRYAIADVAAFVPPGGAIDTEARSRGVTVYLPDGNVPLHPRALSERAASLLPGEERQALVWTIALDAAAEPTGIRVERARVRSRARYTYGEVTALLAGGRAEEPLELMRTVGRLREEAEIARGGVSLPIPDQQVVEVEGRYRLEYRAPVAAEGWNAQLSLLTGLVAARLMLDGGLGVLRTLPPPAPEHVATFRRHAEALAVRWPEGATYPDLIRSLDPTRPAHAALLTQAARLFRGAGYLGFDGDVPVADEALHAAVAAPYAHVTAPLRRLVDRFGNEVVLALVAGAEVPAWAREALEELPALMGAGRHKEAAANGMALDLVEAAVLSGCDDHELRGVVTNTGRDRVQIQVLDPAVVVWLEGADVPLGAEVSVRVAATDLAARRVSLTLA